MSAWTLASVRRPEIALGRADSCRICPHRALARPLGKIPEERDIPFLAESGKIDAQFAPPPRVQKKRGPGIVPDLGPRERLEQSGYLMIVAALLRAAHCQK